MFVNRLRYRNVKPLHRDIPDDGGVFPEQARKRLILQGGNGSGKTTILETIATLWKFWGEWLDVGEGSGPPRHQLSDFLADVDLAAMEVGSVLPGMPPIWIGMDAHSPWEGLKEDYPHHAFAGLHRSGHEWRIDLPRSTKIDLRSIRTQTLIGMPIGRDVPEQEIVTSAARSRPAVETDFFPNVVYLPSDGRSITGTETTRAELLDMMPFNWVARFDQKLSLDSVLMTVKAGEPDRFDESLKFASQALGHRGKRLTGFGENGRLVVEGEDESGQPYQHPIEDLSSGEKQMILMLGFTIAFLQPNGILLIDDPDLHIHISMVDQLLASLEAIVQQRHGQFIVASHSEHVWDWFSREEEHFELGPGRKGQP